MPPLGGKRRIFVVDLLLLLLQSPRALRTVPASRILDAFVAMEVGRYRVCVHNGRMLSMVAGESCFSRGWSLEELYAPPKKTDFEGNQNCDRMNNITAQAYSNKCILTQERETNDLR